MQKNKKIVLISYKNFPYGGASANLLRLFALSLTRYNNEVEVILPTGNYYGDKIDKNIKRAGNVDRVLYKHLCFINHPKNYFGKILDNFLGLYLLVLYLIKKSWKTKLDMIIIYNTTFIRTLILLITKQLLGTKLIIILPEFYEKPTTSIFSLKSAKWYGFYLSMRYLVRYSDGYIVVSSYLERYLREELKIKKNIFLMPNLTDTGRFNLSDVKPYIENKITIGYAGTPTRKDGVIDLMKSFCVLNKEYPMTHLLIIGDITNGKTLVPKLKEYANKLGILDNVTFTGLVSHSVIPSILHSCQILALTRPTGVFAEAGFPVKLGEYFACKKPVVITRVGDIPKYLINEKHIILVEPENIESIVNGFKKLITDQELARTLCNNAYTWMDENLNYINVAAKIDRFLDSLIGVSYSK